MSKQIEAIKLALEVLKNCRENLFLKDYVEHIDLTITAMREALAEQPAQPTTDTVMQAFTGLPKRKLDMLMSADWRINGVSIEHEEAGVIKRGAVTFGGMVLWWNAPQAQPAPEPDQQAAAVMPCGAVVSNVYEAYEAGKKAQPQPAREPLTDEQIDLLINGRGEEGDDDYVEPTGDGFGLTDADLVRLVRRVEAAHGITGSKT